MKGILTTMTAALMAAMPWTATAKSVKTASEAAGGIRVENAEVKRNGRLVSVDMALDLSGLDVNRNREIEIVPALVTESDTTLLEPIGIYGRTRYIQQQRTGRPAGGGSERMLRSGAALRKSPYAYSALVPYGQEMEGARLMFFVRGRGCCGRQLGAAELGPFADFRTPPPAMFEIEDPMWLLPNLEKLERKAKTRSLTGSAFIDYPVNKTEIYPDYRDNRKELAKIRETLDVVFTDPDVTVREIKIKGFASPEGSYSNNGRLAKGRTESLKDYVRDVYKLSNAIFETSWEAEDWAGLREAVEGMDIADKTRILGLIDSKMEPDAKEKALRDRFYNEYLVLLKDVYPGLRRSDYVIDYLVRDFEEAAIIEGVMRNDATKLSPEEFYIAAAAHEPGSPEFDAIYAIALTYYPDDPVANYNMAVSALIRNDAEAAEARLAKAGEGPHVEWAREQLRALMNFEF